MRTITERSTFVPMRYYVVAPDTTEVGFNTLAEAQSHMRTLGGLKAGYHVESRRG